MKQKKKDVCDKCGNPIVQRKDDEPETVRKRIQVYRQETVPLIEHYKKKKMLVDVDSSKKPKEVFNEAVKIIEARIPKQQ